MIYFTSDLHFHHENIIPSCHRPFRNAEDMNEKLIRNWNEVVRPEDEVYILGDVTLKGADAAYECLSQLCGKKYLVRGNHDSFVTKRTWEPYAFTFEWVKDYAELDVHGISFVLCHYPFLEWNHMYRGAIHLHGHQHNGPSYNEGQKAQGIRRYDAGVDANDYRPVSVEEILSFVTQKLPAPGRRRPF